MMNEKNEMIFNMIGLQRTLIGKLRIEIFLLSFYKVCFAISIWWKTKGWKMLNWNRIASRHHVRQVSNLVCYNFPLWWCFPKESVVDWNLVGLLSWNGKKTVKPLWTSKLTKDLKTFPGQEAFYQESGFRNNLPLPDRHYRLPNKQGRCYFDNWPRWRFCQRREFYFYFQTKQRTVT